MGAEDASADYDWYEIWSEDITRRPYVVILFGYETLNRFEAYDPREERTWFTAASYDEACRELWEDEFKRVSGRIDGPSRQTAAGATTDEPR